MAQFTLTTSVTKVLADTLTPVAAYLRLRRFFPDSILLESSDYHGQEDSFSYICCDRIAEIILDGGKVVERYPDGSSQQYETAALGVPKHRVAEALISGFLAKFDEQREGAHPPRVINGLFGYVSFDAIEYMEEIALQSPHDEAARVPELRYAIFRYILAIDHFKNEMYILENRGGKNESLNILKLATQPTFEVGRFRAAGEPSSNFTDPSHIEMILKCKEHIQRGDVFQIVPSRRFYQRYEGDDFQVYRSLRSINPSPYLFYFDCGGYKIMGSSPEAEIVVKDRKATIYPIAGTYPRTGDADKDGAAVERLLQDPKESAEHVMLVDLARNDLSINCHPVGVEKFKEVQLYSHVTHLVSTVSGILNDGRSSVAALTATFPAGTLSGAPKYKAVQLIDRYEGVRRNIYGGALGFIGFNGDINHAIMIRSFLAKDGVLYSQAGGGVVADSVPESEVQEVKNKLAALGAAVRLAEGI